MPLLTPTISAPPITQMKKVLEASGIKPRKQANLKETLDAAGLSVEEIAQELSSFSRSAESEAIRFRAIETAAKMQNMLSDDVVKQAPSVTIIIKDISAVEVNPILFPRG